MLRDRNLIPLSHQHQHALALCVQIDRALTSENSDLLHWQAEIARLFETEIRYHFEAEEKVLFPFAQGTPKLHDLIVDLLADHAFLRQNAAGAAEQHLTVSELQVFAARLSAHVRKEERQLFQSLQEIFSADELSQVGAELDSYFLHSGMPGASCALRGAQDQNTKSQE